jgi:hypothetical protein
MNAWATLAGNSRQMPATLKLPPLRDAQRLVGLYVVQFAHGVSVGYTSDEVALLLRETDYRDVSIFQIHRVDDAGHVELAGIRPADLAGMESILFASRDAAQANRDFATLRRLAAEHPLPCGVRAELIEIPDLDSPHAVCLRYARPASTMVSSWLSRLGFEGGERVFGGVEAESLRQSAGEPIASVLLPARFEQVSRSREAVLASVHEPVQR